MEKYCRAEQATDDNIMWRMRFASRIVKANTNTLKYVVIIDFPRHRRLRERATMLRNIYVVFLVMYDFLNGKL